MMQTFPQFPSIVNCVGILNMTKSILFTPPFFLISLIIYCHFYYGQKIKGEKCFNFYWFCLESFEDFTVFFITIIILAIKLSSYYTAIFSPVRYKLIKKNKKKHALKTF